MAKSANTSLSVRDSRDFMCETALGMSSKRIAQAYENKAPDPDVAAIDGLKVIDASAFMLSGQDGDSPRYWLRR